MAESEQSPIQKIKSGLVKDVITPIGRHATGGVRGELKRAGEETEDANKLAQEFERRFSTVVGLVAAIATKSAASVEDLRAADGAQGTARSIASTVLNGTRNSHAKDALKTMEGINRDTPQLTQDMATLSGQAAELRGGLQAAAETVETAVDLTIVDPDVEFLQPIRLATHAIDVTRKYIRSL